MSADKREFGRTWPAYLAIGAIVAGLAGGFAWTKGWIGSGRVTSADLMDAVEARNPVPFPAGYRRAHAKGTCFTGSFRGNGQATPLSIAQAFGPRTSRVVGRFSIGAGDPRAPDSASRTLAMALVVTAPDGEEWRLAMNNVPYFSVREPEGFLAQIEAGKPDPRTGAPDPARQAEFLKAYPEAGRFMAWAKTAPWSSSWASGEYNGVHAFRLVSDNGPRRHVRWKFRPHAAFAVWEKGDRERAYPDHLQRDLRQRLGKAPLLWDLVLTLADPSDPVNDPSSPWPDGRQTITAGTLEVRAISDQVGGACGDINFDPTILPRGIEISDDPVLAARSAVYSRSFRKRETEGGMSDRAATGQEGQPR